MHQHRLHLVVGGMGHCHGLGAKPASGIEQEPVARFAGCFFKREAFRLRQGPDVFPPQDEWQLERLGYLPHMRGILG